MNITASNIIQFDLPKHLSCPEPTEERNMQRDEVRLLVTDSNGNIHHSTFKFLDNFLSRRRRTGCKYICNHSGGSAIITSRRQAGKITPEHKT